MLQYLKATKSIDIIDEDLKNKLLDILAYYVQMVNKQTNISGSLIDHAYIKKTLMEIFSLM